MSILKQAKRAAKNPPKAKFDATAQAVAYARWLAARDGVALPPRASGDVEWTRVAGARRARFVTFTAWGEPPVTIGIPHWDYVQTCEEICELN